MLRIMVTGGAGYVGSVLVPQLLADGHRVTVLDQFYFGDDTLPVVDRLDRLAQDVRALTLSQLKGHDVVIDLAAMSNDPCGETFSELTRDINHSTRVRTASLARQAGIPRYILPSSCSVYGFQSGVVDEQSPTSPLTVYARSNLDAEHDILALADQRFCVTALRLATLCGPSPRMRLDLALNAMAYSAWHHGEIVVAGGGTQVRPFLHVEDAARAIRLFIEADIKTIRGEIFNIGSNRLNLCINDLAAVLLDACAGLQLPAPTLFHNGPQDLRSYRVDFTKLHTAFAWRPRHNLADTAVTLLSAFDNGTLRATPSCYTLDWYCSLIT